MEQVIQLLILLAGSFYLGYLFRQLEQVEERRDNAEELARAIIRESLREEQYEQLRRVK